MYMYWNKSDKLNHSYNLMNSAGISTIKPVYLVYCEVSTCVCENYVIMKIQKYKLYAWSVVQEN